MSSQLSEVEIRMRDACFANMKRFLENARRDSADFRVTTDAAFENMLATLNDVGVEGFGYVPGDAMQSGKADPAESRSEDVAQSKSAVDAPKSDALEEISEVCRHQIWKFWHNARNDFGHASLQFFVVQEIRKAMEAYALPIQQQRDAAWLAIEHDRSVLADAVTNLRKELDSRHWLTEGRGSYEWDDDRFHSEFLAAGLAIIEAMKPLEKLAADLKNSPQKPEEVAAARVEWKERAEKAESESAALRLALKKVVQMAADHDSDGWSDEIQEFANAALEEK